MGPKGASKKVPLGELGGPESGQFPRGQPMIHVNCLRVADDPLRDAKRFGINQQPSVWAATSSCRSRLSLSVQFDRNAIMGSIRDALQAGI